MNIDSRWLGYVRVVSVALGFYFGRPEAHLAQEIFCYDQPFLFLTGTPSDLELSLDVGPVTTSIDSPSLTKSGEYTHIGTWSTGSLSSFSAANPGCWGIDTFIFRPHVWLGLRDSDDQGTQFDIKAEVLLDGNHLGEYEVRCLKGVTRNPAKAIENVPPNPFPFLSDARIIGRGPTLPTDSELMLKISARIGTGHADRNGMFVPCRGHSSSKGLRVYYGSASRPSHFLWWFPCPVEPLPCGPPIRD